MGPVVGACVLVLLAASAAGGPAAGAEPNFELIGGGEAREVRLKKCPGRPAEGARPGGERAGNQPPPGCPVRSAVPYLGGRMTIVVRNATGAPRPLIVSYLPADGRNQIALARRAQRSRSQRSRSQRILLIGNAKGAPTVPAKSLLRVAVGFVPAPGEGPSALDGSLLLSLAGETKLLPVDVESRTYAGVSFLPATLPIDPSEGEATVTLAGAELVEYLAAYGSQPLVATLYADDGDTAEARLELPTAGDVEGDGALSRARATVTLGDEGPAPGEYEGTLAFPGLPADAGSATVTLASAWSCWWLLLAVLVGVVTIGLGTRLVTTAARRKLLREVLDQTHAVYCHVADTGKTRSWHLDDLLAGAPAGDPADSKDEGPRLQGLAALRRSIASARSSKDLDEDAARVLDMVARMQRWLRVEPLARVLHALGHCRRPWVELPAAKRGEAKRRWDDSNTARDTRLLLAMAKSEPPDVSKADELVAHLLFQVRWHNTVQALWSEAGENKALAAAVRKLDDSLESPSKVGTRTPIERNEREASLQRAWMRFKGCEEPPDFPGIAGEPPSETGADLGITPVDWEASWNLFTGWATLDSQSYGQLARRTATSNRDAYIPDRQDLRSVLRLSPADIAWTFAILAVASAAYATTTYDDSWGGRADLVGAFLAGAVGKAAIDWAALPIFQSQRLRKASSG